MFVSFREYVNFGYETIPKEQFERFINKAGYLTEKWTLGRVTDASLNPARKIRDALVQRNKRGICELAELYFRKESRALGEAGSYIQSFSNEGYSETVADAGAVNTAVAFEVESAAIFDTYFTPEQLCRRAGGRRERV